MCLTKITKQLAPEVEIEAWKVFDIRIGGGGEIELHPVFFDTGRVFVGEWAKVGHPGWPGYHGYDEGFHAFGNWLGAYLWKGMARCPVVRKVRLRGVTQGRWHGRKAYVAQEMMVIWRKGDEEIISSGAAIDEALAEIEKL